MRSVPKATTFILVSGLFAVCAGGAVSAASGVAPAGSITAEQDQAQATGTMHPAATAAAGGAAGEAGAAGKQTFEQVCSGCHELSLVTGLRNTRGGWQRVVDRMYELGLTASDEQAKVVVEYLAATYPAPE